jgi:CelD/BcsL family acetyltransferase involved in cellulose biosynthesis
MSTGPGKGRSTRVEIVTDLEDVAEEWRRLCKETSASPFHGPDFFQAWRAFAPDRLRLVVARRDGDVVGVLPYLRRAGGVRAAANVHSPSYAPVFRDPSAAQALVDGLLGEASRKAALDGLVGADPGTRLLVGALGRPGWRVETTVAQRSPYLDTDGDVEEFRALQHERRAKVRRGLRRAQDRGEVSLSVETGEAAAAAFLGEGLAVEASGWKGSQGTAIACAPDTLAFYGDLTRWAAREDLLRLFTFRLDGRLLAFKLSVEWGSDLYLLKRGYLREAGSLGPGFVIDQALYDHAFEAPHLRRVHHLGVADASKLESTTGFTDRLVVSAYRDDVAGRLRRRADHWADEAVQQARVALPKDVRPVLRHLAHGEVRRAVLAATQGRRHP